MKLYLDTTNAEKIVVGLGQARFETEARKEKSQKLLPFINEVLTKNNKTLKDISELQINTGPGSFTGIRVGVSVANALAWTLKVPINGKSILLDFDY